MRSILCFGDSNTHGTRAMRDLADRRRFRATQRWPGVMAAALGAEFEVIAEGHPARTSTYDDPIDGDHKSGLRALPILLESHLPLDLVIVMLGTNDVKPRFAASPMDISLGLEKIVKTVLASDAGPDSAAPKVLLAAPVPVTESGCLAEIFEGSAAKSQALSPYVEAAAQRQGVAFVDLANVAQADPVDGVHLSAQAQGAIGKVMAQTVREIFA